MTLEQWLELQKGKTIPELVQLLQMLQQQEDYLKKLIKKKMDGKG